MQKRLRHPPSRYSEYTQYGVINGTRVDGENAFCYVFCLEPNYAIITDFIVDESFRNKGFGRRLIHKLKQTHTGHTFFCSSEVEAEPFWKKVAQVVHFSDLPVVVRSQMDNWNHKNFKQFTF